MIAQPSPEETGPLLARSSQGRACSPPSRTGLVDGRPRQPNQPLMPMCGRSTTSGGRMCRLGKASSRKNPRWCRRCFEMAPRGRRGPHNRRRLRRRSWLHIHDRGRVPDRHRSQHDPLVQRRFSCDVQRSIVDKSSATRSWACLYIPSLTATAALSTPWSLLKAIGSGTAAGPALQVGIGLDLDPPSWASSVTARSATSQPSATSSTSARL